MKLKAQYGSGVICLPSKVSELLAGTAENELRVLVRIMSCIAGDSEIEVSQIAQSLKIDESAVSHAIGFWKGAGVLEEAESCSAPSVKVKQSIGENGTAVTTVISDDTPHYTGQEIERLFSAEPSLRSFIDECQRVLGRMFTPLEINKLLALREYHGLDCEYIVLLCVYCKSISRSTVPYLERIAKSFLDEGVTTVGALEEKIAYLERYNSTEKLVRGLCGMNSRKLSAKEKRFVDQWTRLDVPQSLIELAYEVTVNNTGSPSLPYMNKVIMNWTDAGYKSSEDVFAGMEAYRAKKELQEQKGGSFDTDEFFEAALRHSINKHKNTDQG